MTILVHKYFFWMFIYIYIYIHTYIQYIYIHNIFWQKYLLNFDIKVSYLWDCYCDWLTGKWICGCEVIQEPASCWTGISGSWIRVIEPGDLARSLPSGNNGGTRNYQTIIPPALLASLRGPQAPKTPRSPNCFNQQKTRKTDPGSGSQSHKDFSSTQWPFWEWPT